MVQLELAKWLSRENGGSKADQVIDYTSFCHVARLDSTIAFGAAEACRAYRLSTADTVIFATGQAYMAHILTFDAHFKGLPNVTYLPKAN